MSTPDYTFSMQRSDFARILIALRKAKNFSQRDLSQLSGISARMIAYYETHAGIPPLDKLNTLAKVLDVSVAELVDTSSSDKAFLKLNTRTLKKLQLLEQLPPEDQRKVVDYIRALIDQNRLKQQQFQDAR